MNGLLGGSELIEGGDGGGSWAPEHAFERCNWVLAPSYYHALFPDHHKVRNSTPPHALKAMGVLFSTVMEHVNKGPNLE